MAIIYQSILLNVGSEKLIRSDSINNVYLRAWLDKQITKRIKDAKIWYNWVWNDGSRTHP